MNGAIINAVLENLRDVHILFSLDGESIRYINSAVETIFGYSADEIRQRPQLRFECIHPADRVRVTDNFGVAATERIPFKTDYGIYRKNGAFLRVVEDTRFITTDDGEDLILTSISADGEGRFRQMFERNEAVKLVIDPANGMIVDANPAAASFYGYSVDQLRSLKIEQINTLPPEEVRKQMCAAKSEHRNRFNFEHRLASGETRQVEVHSCPLNLDGRELLYSTIFDITAKLRTEAALRVSESIRSQLAQAVEQATESIVISDITGNIVYVNSAFEKITGYSREEVLGENSRLLKSGEQSPEFYQEIWTTLVAGEPWVGRFKNKRKNGTLYEEECTISPIKDIAGKVVNYVAVKRDITKEVELESRLRQAEKLEAVGHLASGIAHDFNNLLAGIRGFGELIGQEAADSPKLKSYSGEIVRAATRAANLTGQLLSFARKGNFLSVPVDIHAIIVEVTSILKHTIDRRIEIRTDLAAKQAFVKGDPSQIQSAILNLSVNARDAMPEGGSLIFTTRNHHFDSDDCRRQSLERGPGEYLAITVTDTGVGIEENILANIFDPFFTTKSAGQGTGLGLAGVYGCVKNHSGGVDVVSDVGRGSVFTVYFPVFEATALPTPVEFSEIVVDGRERILLVDDEEFIRNLAERMLTKAGYQVVTCSDGEEAVKLYRTGMNAIDLVLLDMMMPKMNGRDTFAALKKFNPKVKVLIMSGYSDQDLQEVLSEGIIGFVQKPFQMRAFLVKVREALDTKPQVTQFK